MGDASDNATNTFDDGTTSIDIAALGPQAAPAADTGQAAGFLTAVLTDNPGTTKNDFLFCVNTTAAANQGYDGTTVDYELIVPIDYGATETYYFYVELN
jgi:hypothetical protein